MDKILIYTNKWEEIKKILPYYNKLKLDYEVAWSTDSVPVAQMLNVGKMLVVKYGTYYPTLLVSNKSFGFENNLTIKQFLEAMQDE